MKVNMNKYVKKKPIFIHPEMKKAMDYGRFPLMWILGTALITYLVRIFSYTEAGPLFGISAAFTLFAIGFNGVLLNRISSGKGKVYFRREYRQMVGIMEIERQLANFGMGIFTGNVAYYVSRSRIWNEPEQIGVMFQHLMSYSWLTGLTLIPLLGIAWYAFYGERYILSTDYNTRMQGKVLKFDLTETQAFAELIKEQDEYHSYGHLREVGMKEAAYEDKPEKIKRVEEDEDDIYASARVKRGD